MKIAQVISTPPFAWATGGCARVAYGLSKELAKKGHEVTIITTDLYTPNQRYVCQDYPEHIDGMKILRFKYFSNWLAWKHKTFISPGLIRYLKNHLKEYDVVHLQDLISLQAIATAKYCNKYGISYVLSTHGSIPWLSKNSALNMTFGRFFGNKVMTGASNVLVLNETEAMQCKAVNVAEDKIVIVPNGIDLSEYENLPDKGIFRSKYGIKSNEKIVLFLGRIHKIKGVDLLVDAFAGLVNERNSLKLVIAGPDDGFLSTLKRQIENLNIADKILFTGPLYEQDKLEVYIDADVYVLPSVYETFPVTVLEACTCGTPVIVTDRCGIADIVERIGSVVEYDKDMLRDAIFKVLSNDELRRRLGEAGKILVRETFGWDKVVVEIEQIYLNVMRT